jgi:hypothetical protein
MTIHFFKSPKTFRVIITIILYNQYQDLLYCNSSQYILSTYNSQHNNNNNNERLENHIHLNSRNI